MECQATNLKALEIENLINQMPHIVSSRIISDDCDQIEEIHILATTQRNPKQISRDIQSALAAKYNIKIDYKKISVALIHSEEKIKKDVRLEIESIGYALIGNVAEIKVLLKNRDEEIESVITGINSTNNLQRLVAQATLDCVHKLLGISNTFIFEDIETITLSKKDVVNVAVTYISDEENLLVGSSIVKKDVYAAIVKATLDAINRKINFL